MIKIGSIGYNHSHEDGFFVERPNGPGAWLFLLIKSPAAISVFGKEYNIKAGSAVIVSPAAPCSYRAKELLISTNLLVSDIAGKCGYSNSYNFMSQFRRKTGMTPTEFRKKAAVGEWSKK